MPSMVGYTSRELYLPMGEIHTLQFDPDTNDSHIVLGYCIDEPWEVLQEVLRTYRVAAYCNLPFMIDVSGLVIRDSEHHLPNGTSITGILKGLDISRAEITDRMQPSVPRNDKSMLKMLAGQKKRSCESGASSAWLEFSAAWHQSK